MAIARSILHLIVASVVVIVVGAVIYKLVFKQGLLTSISNSISVLGGQGPILNDNETAIKAFSGLFALVGTIIFSIFLAFLIADVASQWTDNKRPPSKPNDPDTPFRV